MLNVDASRVNESDRPAVDSARRDAEQAQVAWLDAERDAAARGDHALANDAANRAAYMHRRYVRIVHTYSRPET